MTTSKRKIYFVIGPTSSGKTALSIELAKKIGNVEIISADSRQIFRDFDLASGKVTQQEMEGVPHHMLDIVNPGEYFSVIDFTNLALEKIEDIYKSGNIPIVCGGTGFYIDSLLYKYNLPEIENDENLREILDDKNSNELFKILKKELFNLKKFFYFFKNYKTFKKFSHIEFRNNKHRLIRTIEIVKQLGHLPELIKENRFNKNIYDVEIIKTNVSRNVLRDKIYKRIIIRLGQGMIEEIENAKERYNLSFKYLESLGLEFKWIAKFLQKEISEEKMIEKLFNETCQYAKRQDTWFRRY